MVTVHVEDLTITLGEFHLHDVSLRAEASAYFVLLGPTGSGKTVLVECIAGLHQPATGRILLGDADVTSMRPEDRGIGYVPQDYALFPHMTVAANIAFGMKVRRLSASQIEQRLRELTSMLHIEPLMQRHPLTLSGGEKQRVALARALAVRPKVLLLDEPLAAVDESTRDRLCVELLDIQRETGVTILHVSHSFEETLALADQVGVMHNGRMVQCGVPSDVFHCPNSMFVAEFTRSENVFPLDGPPSFVDSDLAGVSLCDGKLRLQVRLSEPDGEGGMASTHAVVRPESVHLMVKSATIDSTHGHPANCFKGHITRLVDRGALFRVEVTTAEGLRWVALVPRSMARQLQAVDRSQVTFSVDPKDIHLIREK